MTTRRRDPNKAKAAILQAARRLFAEQDFTAVSIRDVAAEAQVSHGLVQHHFGTREQLIAAIIAQEISDFTRRVPAQSVATQEDRDRLRRELGTGLRHFEEFAQLITRAELAGVRPESMLNDDAQTPAQMLAEAISAERPEHNAQGLNPALVAAYINAAMFAFATIGPWLMASVGMRPEDLDANRDDIAAISMTLVNVAIEGSASSDKPLDAARYSPPPSPAASSAD